MAGVHGEQDAAGQEPVHGPGGGGLRVRTAQRVRQQAHRAGAEPLEHLRTGAGQRTISAGDAGDAGAAGSPPRRRAARAASTRCGRPSPAG
ncbi:hypothetical protein BJF77_10745 [Kocuria sp. CNJ-770]|nr:hypothetical protein BJF77_10745 [Kocuria sp. CNJ-770]